MRYGPAWRRGIAAAVRYPPVCAHKGEQRDLLVSDCIRKKKLDKTNHLLFIQPRFLRQLGLVLWYHLFELRLLSGNIGLNILQLGIVALLLTQPNPL